MNERGICYVAWGYHSLNEAARSVWWCKGRYKNCLITDITSNVPENVFDIVIRTDFQEYRNLHFFYRKMAALRLSPFRTTLYLDADTYPIGNLDIGFEKAEKFNFSIAIAPGQTFTIEGREYIHYNGGVLFFKGRQEQWTEVVMRYAPTFTESDEPAWSLAFEALGINPAVLPAVYNLVAAGWICDRPIRVWHSRHPLQTHLTSKFDEIFSETQ